MLTCKLTQVKLNFTIFMNQEFSGNIDFGMDEPFQNT